MKAAVFLDRDGVINREIECLTKPEQLELLPGSPEGIRLLNENGWVTIVITNQPIVAKGDATIDDVETIHKTLQEQLKRYGATIDGIYYCPHHPDRGFPGEREEYKISCNCRKPRTGLVEQASKRFDIDVGQSFFVGDKTVDIQTGKNIGCKTILVRTGYGGSDREFDAKPDFTCKNLFDAAKLVCGGRRSK